MYMSAIADLILPVVELGVLDDLVAELEDVLDGLVSLLCEVFHLEQRLATVALHGNGQQVEDLERTEDRGERGARERERGQRERGKGRGEREKDRVRQWNSSTINIRECRK